MTNKTTVAFVIERQQFAMIQRFAKDQDYPSTSSALRRILNEWAVFKAQQNHAQALASAGAQIRATE